MAKLPAKRSSAKSPRVQDIAPAGQSLPPMSAKPILVTNVPTTEDPMMVSTPATSLDSPVVTRRVIKPISSDLLGPTVPPENKTAAPSPLSSPEAPSITDLSNKLAAKETKTEVQAEDKLLTSQEPAVATEVAPKETPKADPLLPPELPPSTPENTATEVKSPSSEVADADAEKKRAEHRLEIASLLESHKYSLPINAVEKRRAKHFVVLGIILSLILLAAWLDIALDAGIVHIDHLHALTHFFSR